MTDRPAIPVETTEGVRPRSSGGERIIVALAGLALVGALLIVASNFLPRDDGVSVASGSPRQTSGATRTPQPTASLLELTVVQESQPPPADSPMVFSGWIRPKVDIPIRSEQNASGPVFGTLTAGELYLADDQQGPGNPDEGWLYVEGPGTTGFIATRDGATDLVERYLPDSAVYPGYIGNLAAGPNGFLAYGSQSIRSNTYDGQRLFASSDGAQWRTSPLPAGLSCCVSGVAWGPAGWILAATLNNGAGTWIWSSQDGQDWSALGTLATDYAESLTASDSGYLMVTGGRRSGRTSLFSVDGIHWTQLDAGLLLPYIQTAITNLGLYAWSDPSSSSPVAAFSADGRRWARVPGPPDGLNLHVVGLRRSLVAIDSDLVTAATRAWIGSIDGGALSWRPMPGAEQEFANAVVVTLVSDGTNATAFGWDRTTEAALVWMFDGGQWQRSELPVAFGGLPRTAVRGTTGMAVVGHSWTARGDNPVVWHWDGSSSWLPERDPVVTAAPDPSGSDCSSGAIDGLAFVNLDRAKAVTCRGDAPLTLRLWSSPCIGCSGETVGTFQQKWLAAPGSNVLYLSPVRWVDGWWTTAVLDPGLAQAPQPGWTGTWLELTGHFDDPAAPACHLTPGPNDVAYYAGVRSIIESCRQQFVVTEVRVVDGP